MADIDPEFMWSSIKDAAVGLLMAISIFVGIGAAMVLLWRP